MSISQPVVSSTYRYTALSAVARLKNRPLTAHPHSLGVWGIGLFPDPWLSSMLTA